MLKNENSTFWLLIVIIVLIKGYDKVIYAQTLAPITTTASITTSITTGITPCSSNPCLNGATCINIGSGFVCVCPQNCAGNTCSSCTGSSACSPNPCKNGGACTPVGTSTFQCSCYPGYYGWDCSAFLGTTTTTTATPGCSSSPCKNGGTCYSVGTSFTCACPSGCQGYDCSYCPSSITTQSPSTCTDYNSNICQTYAALGYCSTNSYVNGALFKVSCAASCKTCVPNTITTTQTPSSTCTDFNTSLCQYYAGLGYCSATNAYINGIPIRTSCAATCNSCTTVTTKSSPSTCVDTQANCVYWANYCYLISNPNPCPKTCKLC